MEIFSNVIYNNGAVEGTPYFGKIFDVGSLAEISMLSIEPMGYALFGVETVQDPVSVFLLGRSENYDFVVLGTFF